MHQYFIVVAIAELAAAGVCEELEIPMDTVKVPGMGYVCKVRECATKEIAADGKRSCVTCDQGTSRDGTNSGSEFCPLALGKCSDGKCVPRTDTDYFETNFGKKWTGLDTFHAVTVTHYGGSTASGGYPGAYDVDSIEKCIVKLGIDGIAAVPPQMYGSDATDGQGMFKRNNLCYKLVGADGLSRVVAVMDRCAGYVQCSGGTQKIEDITASFDFPAIDMAPGATVWADANQCVTNAGALIYSGLGQRCWYYTDGSDIKPKACCPGRCGTGRQQVDWCGSNSHPHFDLSSKLMDLLCDAGGGAGIAAGSCQIQWVEPVKCPVWPRPGVCCPPSQSCGSCDAKPGACGNNATSCAACGGKWCDGDKWHDICNADPTDIPPPYPGWTTNPPDPPVPGGGGGRTPSPPPSDDDDTPTTWPGTKHPGDSTFAPTTQSPTPTATTSAGSQPGPTSTLIPKTTAPHTPTTANTTSPPASPSAPGSRVPAIAGAAAGVFAVLGATAFGATKLRSQPQLEGEFEQEDEAENTETVDREGIIRQGSADFA